MSEETWIYPYRLEPSADAYLFCWGRVAVDKRRAGGPPDPFYLALHRAAGTSQSRRFLVSVGLQAAAIYVECSPGFESVRPCLDRDYAFDIPEYRLPDWEFEPVQETFERWKKDFVPPFDGLSRESKEFHVQLQRRLQETPADNRLTQYALGASFGGYYTNLERAQAEALREFRHAVKNQNLPKAKRSWKAYMRIVEYIKNPKKGRRF